MFDSYSDRLGLTDNPDIDLILEVGFRNCMKLVESINNSPKFLEYLNRVSSIGTQIEDRLGNTYFIEIKTSFSEEDIYRILDSLGLRIQGQGVYREQEYLHHSSTGAIKNISLTEGIEEFTASIVIRSCIYHSEDNSTRVKLWPIKKSNTVNPHKLRAFLNKKKAQLISEIVVPNRTIYVNKGDCENIKLIVDRIQNKTFLSFIKCDLKNAWYILFKLYVLFEDIKTYSLIEYYSKLYQRY